MQPVLPVGAAGGPDRPLRASAGPRRGPRTTRPSSRGVAPAPAATRAEHRRGADRERRPRVRRPDQVTARSWSPSGSGQRAEPVDLVPQVELRDEAAVLHGRTLPGVLLRRLRTRSRSSRHRVAEGPTAHPQRAGGVDDRASATAADAPLAARPARRRGGSRRASCTPAVRRHAPSAGTRATRSPGASRPSTRHSRSAPARAGRAPRAAERNSWGRPGRDRAGSTAGWRRGRDGGPAEHRRRSPGRGMPTTVRPAEPGVGDARHRAGPPAAGAPVELPLGDHPATVVAASAAGTTPAAPLRSSRCGARDGEAPGLDPQQHRPGGALRGRGDDLGHGDVHGERAAE